MQQPAGSTNRMGNMNNPSKFLFNMDFSAPEEPEIMTRLLVGATFSMDWRNWVMAADLPIISELCVLRSFVVTLDAGVKEAKSNRLVVQSAVSLYVILSADTTKQFTALLISSTFFAAFPLLLGLGLILWGRALVLRSRSASGSG